MLEVRGQRCYLYRYRTQGGRVRRVYCGCGEQARQGAREDQRRRAEAEAQKAEQARLEDQDSMAALVAAQIEAVARAALLLEGYFRHERGAWRKRRGH